MRSLVLAVQGGVDSTLTLRGGNKALVGTLGIGTLIGGESVIARLGERVGLSAPTISTVGPPGDVLWLVGWGSVEVSEGRSLWLLLAEIGLDPLSGHHDTRLVLL